MSLPKRYLLGEQVSAKQFCSLPAWKKSDPSKQNPDLNSSYIGGTAGWGIDTPNFWLFYSIPPGSREFATIPTIGKVDFHIG